MTLQSHTNNSSHLDLGSLHIATGGLRGEAQAFSEEALAPIIAQFTELIESISQSPVKGPTKVIAVGRDCRASSEEISDSLKSILSNLGWQVEELGQQPTPAVAWYSTSNNLPAIMITGSHLEEN